MTVSFRLILVFIAVLSTYMMLKKIKQSKLQIQYAIFWVILSGIIVLMAVFPNIMTVFSSMLGVYSPANLVFAAILFLLPLGGIAAAACADGQFLFKGNVSIPHHARNGACAR